MTKFEELCDILGVKPDSVDAVKISGMVNDMIFDKTRQYTDEEIISTVVRRLTVGDVEN